MRENKGFLSFAFDPAHVKNTASELGLSIRNNCLFKNIKMLNKTLLTNLFLDDSFVSQ